MRKRLKFAIMRRGTRNVHWLSGCGCARTDCQRIVCGATTPRADEKEVIATTLGLDSTEDLWRDDAVPSLGAGDNVPAE